MVEFNRTNRESIDAAVDRAMALLASNGGRISSEQKMSLAMDLMAADGANGNDPIDWQKLLSFGDGNFAHDVFGILRHMDRSTGQIGDCFSPRAAMAAAA